MSKILRKKDGGGGGLIRGEALIRDYTVTLFNSLTCTRVVSDTIFLASLIWFLRASASWRSCSNSLILIFFVCFVDEGAKVNLDVDVCFVFFVKFFYVGKFLLEFELGTIYRI